MSPVGQTIRQTLILGLLLGIAGWSGTGLALENGPREVVVQVDQLNLRPEPGTEGEPLRQLPRGSHLTILESGPQWLKVRYQDTIGYVRNRERYLDTSPALDQAREERDSVQAELASHRKALANIEDNEGELLNRLDDLNRNIQSVRKEAAGLRRRIKALEERIAAAETERREVEKRIAAQEKHVGKRLAALYKLNWLGSLNVMASADSINGMVQRKAALERILAVDNVQRESLLQDYERWSFLQIDLEASRKEELAMENRYATQIRHLDREKAVRAALLEDVRSQKRLETAALDALQTAAGELDDTIASLTHDDFETEPPPPGSLGTLKGLLDAPVKGKITNFFGPFKNTRYHVMNFRSGIDFKSERGEPVQAVFAGKVLFADWFKGYGNMLIIDHGHSYCTLYANVEELFKQKGDTVEGGEVIATVGDSGALSGPGLYFEVRHHGKPEDPQQWLKSP
jgi:septal ring factor EnvC (AmiA/AmiB activator)